MLDYAEKVGMLPEAAVSNICSLPKMASDSSLTPAWSDTVRPGVLLSDVKCSAGKSMDVK